MMQSFKFPHGELVFPAYLPDATFGMVRSVDAADLENCEIQAVMMNSFHLMQHPGSSTVQSLGGLNTMSGWKRPIFTDSGGFQVYSLIRQDAKFGKIQEKGLVFQPENAKRKFQLSPEKSIQLQMSYGSDVLFCLDDCTHVDSAREEQEASVRRTLAWAKRCKAEFLRLAELKKLSPEQRPRLFAVVQGGGEKDLRRRCAETLLEIGFDGFGFGGWPLDGQGNLLEDILGITRQCIPAEYPLHALGIGHPKNLLAGYQLGYQIFDCAMPTRDARHARLYVFNQEEGLQGDWLGYVYAGDDRYIKSDRPISVHCDCLCCQRYSLGYLRHLFKMNDSLFLRLATLHNLRFMTQLTRRVALAASTYD